MFNKLAKGIILILIVATVLTLCACFEQTATLPTVEGAESVTISSGACKMNVNDSIEKFVKIFEGLKLAEVKAQTVFGEENEKYNAALEEIEGAHHVVATLADENKVEFYFTDDGKVYYLDGETLFASKSKIDATAALATAKVGEGREIWDIMNTDEVLKAICLSLFASSFPTYRGRDEVDKLLDKMFDGVLFTDNESDLLAFEDVIQDEGALLSATVTKGEIIYLYSNPEEEYAIGKTESLIAAVFILNDGRAILQIDDKIYVTADNIFVNKIYPFGF